MLKGVKSYKKLEFYKNYVDQLNNKTQQLFNRYVDTIKTKPKPNESYEPNSDTSSVTSSEKSTMNTPLLNSSN